MEKIVWKYKLLLEMLSLKWNRKLNIEILKLWNF